MKDRVGKKYGRLTVIAKAESHTSPCGHKVSRWECVCECGNKVIVSGVDLERGSTLSCRCLSKELTSKRKRKYNTYIDEGDYLKGLTFNGYEFYIDKADYDKVKDYCWNKDKNGYIVTTVYKGGKKGIKMHRLIMDFPDDLVIDHINRNKVDNRRNNLRIVTVAENNRNRAPKEKK